MQIPAERSASWDPWAGTSALHTVSEVPGVETAETQQSMQRVLGFLRQRCGTVEEAFRVLDSTSAGCLTLECFARGLEKLGFEGPLAERTRVFQAIDTTGLGSVGLPRFLAAFVEDGEAGSLGMHSTRSIASLGRDTSDAAGGVAAQLLKQVESVTGEATLAARAGDVAARAKSISEELVNARVESDASLAQFEARFDAEVCRLRDFVANIERANMRHVALLDAKTIDVEQLCIRHTERVEAKLTSIQSELAQIQTRMLLAERGLEDLSVSDGRRDALRSEAENVLHKLLLDKKAAGSVGEEDKCSRDDESQTSSMIGRRSEKQVSMVDEKSAGTPPALPGQLSPYPDSLEGKLQHAIRARIGEMPPNGQVQQISAQSIRAYTAPPIRTLSGASSKSVEAIAAEEKRLESTLQAIIEKLDCLGQDDSVAPRTSQPLAGPKLETTLQTIIQKLDSKCIGGLVPDLKELSDLLSTPAPGVAPGVDPGSGDLQARDIHGVVFDEFKALTSGDTNSPDSSDKGSSTMGGGELQKLREDVLGYLRSDFHDLVSTTLKNLRSPEAPPPEGLAARQARLRSCGSQFSFAQSPASPRSSAAVPRLASRRQSPDAQPGQHAAALRPSSVARDRDSSTSKLQARQVSQAPTSTAVRDDSIGRRQYEGLPQATGERPSQQPKTPRQVQTLSNRNRSPAPYAAQASPALRSPGPYMHVQSSGSFGGIANTPFSHMANSTPQVAPSDAPQSTWHRRIPSDPAMLAGSLQAGVGGSLQVGPPAVPASFPGSLHVPTGAPAVSTGPPRDSSVVRGGPVTSPSSGSLAYRC